MKVSQEKQYEIVRHIMDSKESYASLLQSYHDRLLDIYKEFSTFKEAKSSPRETDFKVNKMFEIVNKVLPRIIARNPKWIVSSKPTAMVEVIDNKDMSDEEKISKLDSIKDYNEVIQSLLNFIFDKYGLTEQVRLRAKDMILYGKWIAKAKFKYEVSRRKVSNPVSRVYTDENGEEIEEESNKTEDYVWWEHPCIDNVSRTKLFYDPRYKDFDDLPAVIECIEWVRLSQVKMNKEYFNLDKIESLPNKEEYMDNTKWYEEQVRSILWVNAEVKNPVDKNNLSLKTYYWYYDLWKWESLYRFTTVSDLILIEAEEILNIPFEQIRCFEDTETNLATWFVEGIVSLQRELNFKKNSTSKYINNALNRSWVWSPNSGVRVQDLVSRPNNIIVTDKDRASVENNLFELPHRDINPSYFQEQNDFERQIQAMTFTVDTSQNNSAQALTSTATGARIKFYESNTVMDEVRKHLEEWLSRIAYKLLNEIFDKMGEMDNIVLESEDKTEYIRVHKEAIRDAIARYDIKVESGSSSFDTIENRRDDAIAKYNLWLQAKKAGVNVDLEKLFINVLNTFDEKDSEQYIIKQPYIPQWPVGGSPLPMWAVQWSMTPAGITEQVAQGGITSWLQ